MKALAIIPARYQSTRFPGKPLALLGGRPMLRHVYDNVVHSGLFAKVAIASDDDRILEDARLWKAEAIFTSAHHQSGTDRCAEAAKEISGDYDVIVNVQGDEPFINKKPLEQLLQIFDNESDAGIATLVQKIDNEADIWDKNTAKVALGNDQLSLLAQARMINDQSQIPNPLPLTPYPFALYFSRSPIPFIRSVDKKNWMAHHIFWKHIGLYAFKPEVLEEVVKLPVGLLEKAESLEQLRWLENGYKIYVAETDYKMLSVDTPEDLAKAEKFFNNNVGI